MDIRIIAALITAVGAIAAAIIAKVILPSNKNWVPMSDGKVPDPAIEPPGHEADGPGLYIARAYYAGGRHIGKVRQEYGAALIPYGGKEVRVPKYEVYVGRLRWAKAVDGKVPPHAIRAGQEKDGKPLYVARAHYEDGVHIGKVGPHLGCARIPLAGQEVGVNQYEVLVSK